MVSYLTIKWGIPIHAASVLFIVAGFALGAMAPDFMRGIFDFINGFVDICFDGFKAITPDTWYMVPYMDGHAYTEFGWAFEQVHRALEIPTGRNKIVWSSVGFYFVFEILCFFFFLHRFMVKTGENAPLNNDTSIYKAGDGGMWIFGGKKK